MQVIELKNNSFFTKRRKFVGKNEGAVRIAIKTKTTIKYFEKSNEDKKFLNDSKELERMIIP